MPCGARAVGSLISAYGGMIVLMHPPKAREGVLVARKSGNRRFVRVFGILEEFMGDCKDFLDKQKYLKENFKKI